MTTYAVPCWSAVETKCTFILDCWSCAPTITASHGLAKYALAIRRVAWAFAEEQPRLLPLPVHPFPTDLILPIRSQKTTYIRFDLNDYSIPPEALGRPLTLVASDSVVRILDGTQEIARHTRSYDRHQQVLHPPHQAALLQLKRKAFHST